MSLAKSRSSSVVNVPHLIPLGMMLYSMAMIKSVNDITQPWRTPVLTSNSTLVFPTLHLKLT